MAVGSTNFSTLITTTLQNLPGDLFDNVTTNNALLYLLKKAGNVKIVGGGRSFTHPLIFQQNSTFAARAKYDTIDTTVQDNATRANYNIKIIDGSVAISTLELAMNAGDREKLIDLAEEKKMEAEIGMSQVLASQLFNTAVTDASTNNLDSLPYLISETPSLQTDVGGIDSSAAGQTYWRNQIYATAVTAFGTSQAGLNAMDTLLNLATFGTQGPTCIITTKAIFTLYQLALTANVRYTAMDLGDAGFKALQYATIPVVFDDSCPAGDMFFVDTNSMKLQILAQGNMKSTKFMQSHTQLVELMLMYVFCNLTCGSRRTQGKINSITG